MGIEQNLNSSPKTMTNTYPYIYPSSKTLDLDFLNSELWFRNGWYWDFWWKPPGHLIPQKSLPHLEWHHIRSVLLAEAQVVHKELQHFKGLLFTHVQKQDSSHKADALTVAHLFVQQRVGFQQVKEGQLPCPKLHWKVRVSGKCPSCRREEEPCLEIRGETSAVTYGIDQHSVNQGVAGNVHLRGSSHFSPPLPPSSSSSPSPPCKSCIPHTWYRDSHFMLSSIAFYKSNIIQQKSVLHGIAERYYRAELRFILSLNQGKV